MEQRSASLSVSIATTPNGMRLSGLFRSKVAFERTSLRWTSVLPPATRISCCSSVSMFIAFSTISQRATCVAIAKASA